MTRKDKTMCFSSDYDCCPECGGQCTEIADGTRGQECERCDGYGVVSDEWGWDQDIGGEG